MHWVAGFVLVATLLYHGEASRAKAVSLSAIIFLFLDEDPPPGFHTSSWDCQITWVLVFLIRD